MRTSGTPNKKAASCQRAAGQGYKRHKEIIYENQGSDDEILNCGVIAYTDRQGISRGNESCTVQSAISVNMCSSARTNY
jgi:hypothetical protein